MKVLQILPEMTHSGVSRSALEVSKALVVTGHDSIVVSQGGHLVSRLEKDKGKHIQLPINQKKLSVLLQIKPLRKIILQEKPDIIHVRSRMVAWITNLALRSLCKTERPIVVSTVHNIYAPSRYSQSIIETDWVISVSDYVSNHLKNNFPKINQNRLTKIYRGIDPKAYPYLYQPSVHWWNNILAEFPHLENKIWLTLPETISKSKGHQWLLDIIGGLKTTYPNIHAIFIGEPKSVDCPYNEELKLRINALGLNDFITFVGHRDDKREWLAASNIVFAIEGKPRSFGRVVLESLSLGTPVIGWDQGGVSEILNAMYPEGLVKPDDCLGLCEKVRQHIEEKPRPKKSHLFLLKRYTHETIALYQDLLTCQQTQEIKIQEHHDRDRHTNIKAPAMCAKMSGKNVAS